jgi:hypothetical protein
MLQVAHMRVYLTYQWKEWTDSPDPMAATCQRTRCPMDMFMPCWLHQIQPVGAETEHACMSRKPDDDGVEQASMRPLVGTTPVHAVTHASTAGAARKPGMLQGAEQVRQCNRHPAACIGALCPYSRAHQSLSLTQNRELQM